jgi:hypothetical protein
MGAVVKVETFKTDVLNGSLALFLIWAMSSYIFEYFDPVLFRDVTEQLVA